MYLPLRRRLQNIINKIPAIISIAAIILLWHILSVSKIVPSYMLPSPMSVVSAFVDDFDIIMSHAQVTLTEAFLGLFVGIVFALVIATAMDRWKFMDKALYPIMIITQTIPTIAIAPLLVLWMGFDMEPKITLVALTTFFPIAISLLDGYKSVDKDYINLIKSMGAGRWNIYTKLKLPSALPYFFSGLKVSVSYAVVGAVISEWLGGFEGLGVYMTRVRKAYAFDKMFAVIIFIVVVSLLLMWLVNVIKYVAMPWDRLRRGDKQNEYKK